jgi:hypothetical protein
MMIPDIIATVAKAFRSGANPNIIKLVLMSDGLPSDRADTIIAWAKLRVEREVNDD